MILFTASGVLGLDTAKRWDVSGMLSMFGMFILEFLESRTSRPEVIVDFVHPNGAALLDLSLVTMPKGSTDLNGICRRIDKKKSKRSWFNIYIYVYISYIYIYRHTSIIHHLYNVLNYINMLIVCIYIYYVRIILSMTMTMNHIIMTYYDITYEYQQFLKVSRELREIRGRCSTGASINHRSRSPILHLDLSARHRWGAHRFQYQMIEDLKIFTNQYNIWLFLFWQTEVGYTSWDFP